MYEAHNALEDAMACGKLVLMSAERFGIADITELLNAAGLKLSELN